MSATSAPELIREYSIRGIEHHQKPAPPVSRFVVLSFLLHVLLVLLFADAVGVRPGTSLWGSFVANLESRTRTTDSPAPNASLQPPTLPARVDRVQPSRSATTSTTAPTPVESKTAETQTQTQTQTQTPAQTSPPENTPVLAPDTPAALPPLLAKEVIKAETDFVVPAFAPIPDAGVSKSVQQPAAPVPITAPTALEKLATPKIEKTFTPYVEPPRATVTETKPLAPPLLAPPLSAPAPLEKLDAPKTAQEIAPFVPPQVLTSESPTLAVPPTFAPTPTPIAVPAPTPVLVAPVERLEKLAAPKVDREFAPYVEPKRDVEAKRDIESRRDIEPKRDIATAPPSAPSTAATTANDVAKSRTDVNNPPSGANAKPGQLPSGTVAGTTAGNVPSSASGTASGNTVAGNNANPATLGPAPKLDLDSIRARAREIANEGSQRSAFGFPALPKETPKKSIEKIFDKALQRPDCKDAYTDMGLAAVVPLIRDTVKNEGCRW
jgi:hypothetical protein